MYSSNQPQQPVIQPTRKGVVATQAGQGDERQRQQRGNAAEQQQGRCQREEHNIVGTVVEGLRVCVRVCV